MVNACWEFDDGWPLLLVYEGLQRWGVVSPRVRNPAVIEEVYYFCWSGALVLQARKRPVGGPVGSQLERLRGGCVEGAGESDCRGECEKGFHIVKVDQLKGDRELLRKIFVDQSVEDF